METTFSQQMSNSRQAERSAFTMEPLISKTVIHAGRTSLLPGCKMPIVFLTIRTRYDSKIFLTTFVVSIADKCYFFHIAENYKKIL